ncbi:MAG: DUF1211 domain-containing protein, partial [Gammaproteobacteria bacterium]|nr:DUF1211 domain-containing protein [Gammaproteobacteria bacterium]
MAKIATISAEFLAACPVKNGFRLRGHDMTRIETFTDAAFAFAVTMLVISVDEIPGTFDELLAALKGVPAFAACFAQIMLFWYAHLVWSRRFGLEDMPTVILSCLLVFVVMVYIYPLKILFSSMFAYFSSGWLPSEMEIRSIEQLSQVFVIFGTGFVALSVVITS